ncbi:rtf2 RING-finger domain-containing protein [Ditylenchus destructor]|nr:rtf2 RING-finger domain-containing protein [Ditylenchus destructor]
MGADGGTIPKRCELVRNKKKKEKIDKNVRAAVSWRTCQITQLPLEKPIVACKLGRLYNKEAIIKAKLDKKLQTNEVTKHIKKLSDVKELRLTDNRSFKDDGPENGDTYYDHNETPWVCPVTAIPMNGSNNFFVNWQCGCVVSEKAINELKPDVCVSCSGPYDPAQTIMLYPGDDLLKEYEQRIASEHVQKKASRKAAIDSAEAIGEKEQQDADGAEKPSTDIPGPSNGRIIKNTDAKSKTKNGEKQESDKAELGQKRKQPQSIQDDPSVSKAVKALYTSSDAAKNQPTAHWVTHNPCFY